MDDAEIFANPHSDIGAFCQDVIDEVRQRPGAYTPKLLQRWLVQDAERGAPPRVDDPTKRAPPRPPPQLCSRCGQTHLQARCP